MRIGVTARPDMPEAITMAADVAEFILERGGNAVLDDQFSAEAGWEGDSAPLDDMDIDVIITVGGDGTILRTAQHTTHPIFGINMGALGFLAEVQPGEWREGVARLLRGEYTIETRAKLSATVGGVPQPPVVNEAVIHTTQISKMRHFEVKVDSSDALRLRADGLIIATPTGSTCYAMSVGSPIVDPKAKAFIIVPIAPFKLSARPFVVSSDSRIEVRLLDGKDALLVLDGQAEAEIAPDQVVAFEMSDERARFIRFDTDFYRRFRKKLMRLMTTEEV